MAERRPTTSKYPLRIYMRNEGTSLELTGDDGIITVESRAMLNQVPPRIETWGCKWRRMSDGRCFVVMRTFVPSHWIIDLLFGKDNFDAKQQLLDYFAREMHNMEVERKYEELKRSDPDVERIVEEKE